MYTILLIKVQFAITIISEKYHNVHMIFLTMSRNYYNQLSSLQCFPHRLCFRIFSNTKLGSHLGNKFMDELRQKSLNDQDKID